MPLRSPKMKRRIFGFQRRVWWPKWTPASSSCFMVTTATGSLPRLYLGPPRPSLRTDDRGWRACEFSDRGPSCHQCRSGHRNGLHPVGPSEPHGEDQPTAARADPDREPSRVDAPDDPARVSIDDHHLAAVRPDDDGMCAEHHPRFEDRLADCGLPPRLARTYVDERDRPEVVGYDDVAAGRTGRDTRLERRGRGHGPAFAAGGEVAGDDACREVAVALAE